jgi:hypothetical protein
MTLSRRNLLLAAIPPRSSIFFQRGVNFTAERGAHYGEPGSLEMLARLPAHGVNSIALVPYAFTPADEPAVRMPRRGGMENEDGLKALARRAHELGMRVLLKPHVWTRGGFPGDLDYPDAAARRAWFAQYRAYIEHEARLAQEMKADLLCVGNEFVKLSKYETEWRQVFAAVRKLYGGPLTYAAVQGPEFEELRFWDAVDYIGLNNYYPLPDSLDCTQVQARIERVQRAAKKPVIFTEAGFSSLTAPHRAPWDESPRAISLEAQSRCYEAVLRAFYQKPWFQGVYWWKVGTNGFGGAQDGSHTPWNKPAWQVVSRWYKTGGR